MGGALCWKAMSDSWALMLYEVQIPISVCPGLQSLSEFSLAAACADCLVLLRMRCPSAHTHSTELAKFAASCPTQLLQFPLRGLWARAHEPQNCMRHMSYHQYYGYFLGLAEALTNRAKAEPPWPLAWMAGRPRLRAAGETHGFISAECLSSFAVPSSVGTEVSS